MAEVKTRPAGLQGNARWPSGGGPGNIHGIARLAYPAGRGRAHGTKRRLNS